MFHLYLLFFCFFFNDTATTEIYTLSLHDALPIYPLVAPGVGPFAGGRLPRARVAVVHGSPFPSLPSCQTEQCSLSFLDRKSTRLNSSHMSISYAVFCLKKKKKKQKSH